MIFPLENPIGMGFSIAMFVHQGIYEVFRQIQAVGQWSDGSWVVDG
jgi:hypothetical protein